MDRKICMIIGQAALQSVLYEVSATPKPGLVDRASQGAHKDMDFFSFMASSAALAPYFTQCAIQGAGFGGDDARDLFLALRPIGIEAEKAMFKATGGVNTHKGLIFSLGVLSAAAAFCWHRKKSVKPDAENVCKQVSRMTQGLCAQELAYIEKDSGLTHGERVYIKYGIKGVRGEVEDGFPTVRTCSLPVYERLHSEGIHSLNDMLVQTLLHLMAVNEDTNILARQDKETLDYVRKYAAVVLEAGGMFTAAGRSMVDTMDREFILKNISPGGSADLLAVTVMLHLLNRWLSISHS